ncbi:glucosamine 6-phosphate synthetase [Marinobacterium sp. xm-d-530]|uniref:glucosamine 6-phosphate synthetase n=1 Tax=Marinobacterium sp. xm-d-530 TaxID=2497747 RepID=UPI001567EA2F|nr:glucosamine 6-phosphate synthetase [Marinobacterium sp. xm-d-530]NRQ01174.1 Glutamine--fructose-6-phosphate aminotransferase [isomerizing] [Marinobacterium sp. xm-d-530]
MCGIFGVFSKARASQSDVRVLANHARQRGRDSSGLVGIGTDCKVFKADFDIRKLFREVSLSQKDQVIVGHSRLMTNGSADNQPVVRHDIIVVHNGIIVNDADLWASTGLERNLEIDSEVIAAIVEDLLAKGGTVENIPKTVLEACDGVVSAAVLLPKLGLGVVFSNNGSLYVGTKSEDSYFSSERFPLTEIGCENISQIREDGRVFDFHPVKGEVRVNEFDRVQRNLIPKFQAFSSQEKMLSYEPAEVKRCSRCILPETMPFISFDANGVCNYCNSYKLRNVPKPKSELFDLVKPYRKESGIDCIVPFSGGRDSCYGLHLIVEELKMAPVTYTYDWGMVTDLGRRNISRMCSKLGVENIIIAADIGKKRRNIRLNLEAWLKSPHLGMMAMLTAGDKHFFRHVETVKKQTGVQLNLWGVNPLEVTHFKTGFLGIPPDFEEKNVYSHGIAKQLRYHYQRTKAMLESPGYFNRSLFDTLSGEYFRSFTEKKDYYHIFDYWRWDESIIDDTLLNQYDWEKAPDTTTTWRIGDGTAALYNYIYYTVAGFTEHDTFRSNQIREGQLSRDEALRLVEIENRPRYQNIRWYLDTLDMDFEHVIKVINSIPKLYTQHV